MTRLHKLQRISAGLRWLVIIVAATIFTAVITGPLLFDQWWVAVGDATFNQLWQDPAVSHALLSAVISPLVVMAALVAYWLQRLFGEFQRGGFFTDSSMRCFLWLVWLKVGSFVYTIAWPLILGALPGAKPDADTEITIDVSAFFTLLLLVVIVHLLREAQAINRENREFV